MNILKKFCLIGLCAFSVIFCEAIIPMQPAYAYQENISRGYELIEETWQGRDGSIMSITDRDFGEAPYSVRSVSNDGNYTVVTISVNGGRSINTLTFDNNNPNYMMLNIKVYFADAYAAWQRGSNENSNGLLREYYPKKTDLGKISNDDLIEKLILLNSRPRKCLNWDNPFNLFLKEVSHLD